MSEQDQKERALQVVESSASMLEKILECRSTAVRNSLKYKRTTIVPVNVPEEKRRGHGGDNVEEPLTRSRFRGILGEEDTTYERNPNTPPPSNLTNTNNSNSLNTSSNMSSTAPSRNTDGRTTAFESPAIR